MALDPPGAAPAPGMPDGSARRPGGRQHGCRRPSQTGRSPRSRRSATRRSHPAGRARLRHAGPPQPGPRIGASCSAARGSCTRAGTAPGLPSNASGSARLAPHQSSASAARPSAARPRETSPGKVSLRGCSGASWPSNPDIPVPRPSPSSIRRAMTASSGAGRFLAAIPQAVARQPRQGLDHAAAAWDRASVVAWLQLTPGQLGHLSQRCRLLGVPHR